MVIGHSYIWWVYSTYRLPTARPFVCLFVCNLICFALEKKRVHCCRRHIYAGKSNGCTLHCSFFVFVLRFRPRMQNHISSVLYVMHVVVTTPSLKFTLSTYISRNSGLVSWSQFSKNMGEAWLECKVHTWLYWRQEISTTVPIYSLLMRCVLSFRSVIGPG